MVEILIANATDILVAIIGGYFLYLQSRQKKQQIASDKKAEERKRESLLSMEMAHANMELTLCIARNMIAGDSTICDVQQATKKAEEAAKKYEHFLEELKAERLF